MRLYYYRPDVCVDEHLDFENAYEFLSNRDINAVGYPNGVYDELELEWLIQDMAEDFMDHHDGWETFKTSGTDSVFAVWSLSEAGFIGLFNVTVEYEPRFSVSRSKDRIEDE